MDEPPKNLKTMLSEAKDTSELMVDLAYAALYYNAHGIAGELGRLEARLSALTFDMRALCLIASRSRRDAEEVAGVPALAGAKPLREDDDQPVEGELTDLGRAIDVLVEMKDISELAVGLAYSAVLFDDRGLAAEVGHLEDRMADMREQLELWVLRAASQT